MCCDPVLREQPPIEMSPDAVRRHLDLDPVSASVGLARAFVREALPDLDDGRRESALLLTSELVTNAILHARTPVQVGLVLDEHQVLLCVSDKLADPTALTPRAHSGDRAAGRGLALVADLAERWGTTAYTGGKTVWCLIRRSRGSSLRAG